MGTRWDRAGLSLAVMALALAFLPVLAVLQSRWIGRVSEAERERMRAHLEAATMRFGQDFDGELARLFVTCQSGRPAAPGRELEEYAERYARWDATAPQPGLVRHFYVARGGPAGVSELLRFNAANGRLEAAEWPAGLAGLRARLESRGQGNFPPAAPLMNSAVEEEIPALVGPRWRPPPQPDFPRPGRRVGGAPVIAGWWIAELDLEFIQKEFLPQLIQRHFGRTAGLDYALQIVSKAGTRKVIYRSDPGLPEAMFASADMTIGLLSVRPEPAARMWGPNPGARRPPVAPGVPVVRDEVNGRWQLMVTHRLGSLETAVRQTRHRNLAISFAVLLLLAASIAMLVVWTQRAQRLAGLQMEFVAGVSHELRTPLTVICSAADNLADGLVSNEQQAQRYGTVIGKEGRRLSEMVEQILAFAGAQAGRIKYNFQPVEVPEIIGRALAACERAVQESGCQIQKRIQPDLPPVLGDPAALTQCLRNLLSNALKYARDGGWIGVRAESVTAGPLAQVEITIEDKGPGIEPADLPHIFEPFYRARRAVAGQIRGAGLGLNLVKRIVEAHAGSVQVTSTPGQGARFRVRIPAAPEPPGAP